MKRRIAIALGTLAFLALIGFFAAPYSLPRIFSVYRSDICFASTKEEKRIFITIDDAPSGNTPEILRVLKKYDVPATFFIIAGRVSSTTQLDQIVAAHNTLGNHLKTTKACSRLSISEFVDDFDMCANLIESIEKNARLFRPASGFGSLEQVAYAKSKGYRAVVGTVFPLDHWISDSLALEYLARWLCVSGGIVILHDGEIRGRTTAEVLDRLIPKLKAAGYRFGRLEIELGVADGVTRSGSGQ